MLTKVVHFMKHDISIQNNNKKTNGDDIVSHVCKSLRCLANRFLHPLLYSICCGIIK